MSARGAKTRQIDSQTGAPSVGLLRSDFAGDFAGVTLFPRLLLAPGRLTGLVL